MPQRKAGCCLRSGEASRAAGIICRKIEFRGQRENQIRDRKVIRMLNKGLSEKSQMKTNFSAGEMAERAGLPDVWKQEGVRRWCKV